MFEGHSGLVSILPRWRGLQPKSPTNAGFLAFTTNDTKLHEGISQSHEPKSTPRSKTNRLYYIRIQVFLCELCVLCGYILPVLLLDQRDLVLSDDSAVDSVRQLESRVDANIRIARFDVLFDKKLQHKIRDFDAVKGN